MVENGIQWEVFVNLVINTCSTKGGIFLEYLNDYQDLKEDSGTQS